MGRVIVDDLVNAKISNLAQQICAGIVTRKEAEKDLAEYRTKLENEFCGCK
jgi:hypothetical protein